MQIGYLHDRQYEKFINCNYVYEEEIEEVLNHLLEVINHVDNEEYTY